MRICLYIIFFLLVCFSRGINAQNGCLNTDFELTAPGTYTAGNAVTGWSVSSQLNTGCPSSTLWTPGSPEFSVITTPISHSLPIGAFGHSPLGGTNVLRFNDFTPGSLKTKISKNITVTSPTQAFTFAFAGVWQFMHSCCDSPQFKVEIKYCDSIAITCPAYYGLEGFVCASATTFTSWLAYSYTAWQVSSIQLGQFMGSCITIEITNMDCTVGDHFGTLYFDAICPSNPSNFSPYMYVPPVNFCLQNNQAILTAPHGFNIYQWNSSTFIYPNASTSNTLLGIWPFSGQTYTVAVTSFPCTTNNTYTYVLVPTTTTIVGIGSTPSCPQGSSGSASVIVTGSGLTYTYNWTNSSNTIVGTNSTINNMPPGIYSVAVTGMCGNASATVMIGSTPPTLQTHIQPYCIGQPAYLNLTSTNAAIWYSAGVSAGSGNSFTVSAPVSNSVISAAHTNSLNCRDTISYVLLPVSSGSITFVSGPLVCPGSPSATAIVSLTAAPGTYGDRLLFAGATGTTPSFSHSVSTQNQNTFTITGVQPGTYSVQVFDGSCIYTKTLALNNIPMNFVVSPIQATVCAGAGIAAAVAFYQPVSNGGYTYSWSPNQFLAGNINSFQNTIITPTVIPGAFYNLQYSVTVTSITGSCVSTKVLSLTVSNPISPTISAVPPMCQFYGSYTIQAAPVGGTFHNGLLAPGVIDPSTGVLNSNISIPGVHAFSYSHFMLGCAVSASATYSILQSPNLSISGNTAVCSGKSTTLNFSGGSMYMWDQTLVSASIVISPTVTNQYMLTGIHNLNSCQASKTLSITVLPTPTILIAGRDSLCKGASIVLTAGGGSLFKWSTGAVSQSINISPTVTTVYNVVGTSAINTCTSLASKEIRVFHNPTVEVTGNLNPCEGDLLELTASGAMHYEWNGVPGIFILSSATLPTGVIKLRGTDAKGCSHSIQFGISRQICTKLVEIPGKEFLVFPNPFKNSVEINLPCDCTILIYDTTGKLIDKTFIKSGEDIVDLRHVPAGLYFMTVVGDQEIKTVKLIKE